MRWFIGVAAVVFLAASPRGQTAGDYAAAVQAYVVGHKAAEAVGPIAMATPGQFRGAAERYLNHPQPMFTAAAALQLEIAVGLVTISPELAASHLELGYLFIRNLRPPSRNIPSLSPADTVAFTERWCAAAASTFLLVNDSARALPFINRGLQVAPKSPDLRLMAGIVDELAARLQGLMRARAKFEKLLADEPRFTRARIRLGRVLWMLDDRDAR